jgi:formylglycine-generating enzyme required for sulfatase activity
MPEDSPLNPLSQARHIDRICDRFEAAWNAGLRPKIEEFLKDTPAGVQADLLPELVILDLQCRRQVGETPRPEDYLTRLPTLDRDWLVQQIASPIAEGSPHAFQTVGTVLADARVPDGQLPRIRYLGDYELVAEIARGGMGVVYQARQISLDRTVAVKMILAGRLATKADHDRFHAEAQAAALLDHPNIVPIFEVGDHEGQHYFSMGYVDGQSLAARLVEGPLPPKEAAELVATVAEAVEYAHRLGVIHHDIKPSNIIIDSQGRPRVTDFGLAKLVDSGSELTATGQVLGTPSYMPPEQAAGQISALSPAADVYALGALLYSALTGHPPFQAATPLETLKQVIEREPVALRQLNAAIPRDLETIALKCLEKSVPRRYASAQALAEDLRRYLAGRPIVARPVSHWERGWRWCRRQPVLAGLAAASLLLLALVAAAVVAWHNLVVEEDSRARAQVERLRMADIAQVSAVIEGLQPYRRYVDPWIRALLKQPDLSAAEHLRLSLALVASDPEQEAYLRDRLLASDPAELELICTALSPYRDGLVGDLWGIVDTSTAPDRSFRAACALAAIDPASTHWKDASKAVVAHLVAEDPKSATAWAGALRPVRASLLRDLSRIFRDPSWPATERWLATSVLADYAKDQAEVLADLLMDADEKQFAIVYEQLSSFGDQARPAFIREIDRTLAAEAGLSAQETLAKRKANAAVVLARMKHAEKVWPLLKHSPDPRTRSYLVHRLAPMGVDPRMIIRRFGEEPDITIRRALILSLGEFSEQAFAFADRRSFIGKLQDVYHNENDPGLRSAAEWLLRTWKQDAWLNEATTEWTINKAKREQRIEAIRRSLVADEKRRPQWYVNSQGQTMVVIPGPAEFMMGAPPAEEGWAATEYQHKKRIPRFFAIATVSVTREQYQIVDSTHRPPSVRLSRTGGLPAFGITWHMAASYCNWLSRQEGIADDQWCFEIDARGRVKKLRAHYLSLVGYRLPTEAEMEYAIRAGSQTARFFGETGELLDKYAWYQKNADNQTWPVGTLKPNDLGLFDVQGNVNTWCMDRALNIVVPQSQASGDDLEDATLAVFECDRMWRGGFFHALTPDVRSARRFCNDDMSDDFSTGFRVVRTFH